MARARTSAWQAATAVLILTLLLATGLRFYRLDAQSFWNDEGNSARLSERDLGRILEGTASDIHPPLYYLLLRGWRELAGEDEFGLRAFSVFAGVLTVAATAALARLLTHRRRGHAPSMAATSVVLIAALLAAVNPALVYYSQETRMYALLALLAALATLCLLRWLRAERAPGWMLGYVLTAVAGLYTHYYFPVVLGVHALLVLAALWPWSAARVLGVVRPWRRTLGQGLGMATAVLLLYAPWMPIFLRQAGGRPPERVPLPAYLWDAQRWLAFGETLGRGELLWAAAAVSGLLLLALWRGRWRVSIPFGATLALVLAMFAIGTTQAAFFKFLTATVPFFVIWLAMGAAGGRASRALRLVGAAALALVLLGTAVSLNNLYHNPAYARADYRGMAARIAAEAHPNAGIILDAPNQWEVFTYYHRDGAPVYPLPLGQPDPAILEPQLAQIAADHDRIYAIFWGEAQRDPQRVVERWLDAHAFKAADEWVGDVRFVVYAVPPAAATEPATPLQVAFGPDITLEGFTLTSQAFAPGDIVPVTLFWRTAVTPATRTKVFLHLLDANGRLVAQRDSEPGGGLVPTTTWTPGETVIDNHGILLPLDLPPGDYALVVGLYDAANPAQRLPVAGGDSLALATIRVR